MKVDEPMMGAKPKDSIDEDWLAKQWDSIDWHKVITIVNRLQKRIVKATIEQNWNKARKLSYLLVHSQSAKMLAVRKVTTNKGKNTPGVDGEIWNTPALKMKGALSLTDKHYRAKPLKRVFIDKKGKKEKRPLGIPTMYDRAMQALYALALSPIAETTADKRSFGFRIGRSAQDAARYMHIILSNRHAPEWVLEGDIKGCFDNINHNWLLANIPMDKKVLRQFLKAGFIYDENLFPTDNGTPQGGVISPILANMTLDGIQKVIDEINGKIAYPKTNLVRFADDFIITAPNKEKAELIKGKLKSFFKTRGLELSDEKTLITHINDGFDFLGWNFRKYNGVLIIQPSKKSIQNFKDKAHEIILKNGKADEQDKLIDKINPLIRGWANYHKNTCAKRIFSSLDADLFHKLWRWEVRRHPDKGKRWIEQRYWHKIGKEQWVFSTDTDRLIRMAKITITRIIPLKLDMNPYTDWKYFLNRKSNHTILAA